MWNFLIDIKNAARRTVAPTRDELAAAPEQKQQRSAAMSSGFSLLEEHVVGWMNKLTSSPVVLDSGAGSAELAGEYEKPPPLLCLAEEKRTSLEPEELFRYITESVSLITLTSKRIHGEAQFLLQLSLEEKITHTSDFLSVYTWWEDAVDQRLRKCELIFEEYKVQPGLINVENIVHLQQRINSIWETCTADMGTVKKIGTLLREEKYDLINQVGNDIPSEFAHQHDQNNDKTAKHRIIGSEAQPTGNKNSSLLHAQCTQESRVHTGEYVQNECTNKISTSSGKLHPRINESDTPAKKGKMRQHDGKEHLIRICKTSDNSEEETHLRAEEEARLRAEEEARLRAEEEARLRAEEEARLRAEEEARLRAEEEARLRAEEEARLRAEEEARLRAEEEARLRAEEEARLRAEEEARLRAEEEARLRAEEEARLRAEEEARLRAEEEARLRAEEEARLRAEEEARLRAEEEARLRAEEEARLRAEEEARLRAEEEARLRAEEEARLRAEEEARLRAEEEARLRAEEEARLRAEEEARLRAEEEARLRAEEEARLRAEEEARLRAEEEARLRAEEEARLRAEEEARLRAEEEARLRAEEEARLRAEEEARLRAEEEACCGHSPHFSKLFAVLEHEEGVCRSIVCRKQADEYLTVYQKYIVSTSVSFVDEDESDHSENPSIVARLESVAAPSDRQDAGSVVGKSRIVKAKADILVDDEGEEWDDW
ncbi:Tb-291 membrane associated protein, putative [Trypanosoma brucei brucei TREU927]|uniref:Tb-291 membrane associated protein, putative n=1 Tax=Trypanosoma brucei brucei (strain 927/4 GUTat10.1) TaxID=185431 RepID=Q381N6_TRYB2|nr:Tb-291 membrane associated protein, putative [Trypanosoma brucei brucei TREU927]EAN80495.1 Tb-291 membrane associated protein, putative [Trypanosoma brucei brucei TREU927]